MPFRKKAPVEVESRADEPQDKVVSERLAKMIDTSPAVRDLAVEVGLVDKTWLDQPSRRKPEIAPPLEVLRRFVERTAERHPSALSGLGLNAVQVLSWDRIWNRGLVSKSDTVSTATVVFTDLEGFTSFTARYGDEAALALLDEHQRATAPVIRRWGGRVVKHLGDGLMLVFPNAASAVYAALDLLPTTPKPLRLRAGMHTGELVVTSDDLVGNVVNIAARVTAEADGGEVLVTAATLETAGELAGVRVLRTRKRALKGIAERVSMSRVERR
ncbi:MAG TPA: adenylate/guanylate cyclase domain-containing protein [Jatrophihabitantaceae bacterium]|nr:adenylate/guanylate cyclase domain-containing protein [Jatrophihabitantaceae bacterium]